MPITINGTGTVTGISAGGLPDGSVAQADLVSGVVNKGPDIPLFVAYKDLSDNYALPATTGTIIFPFKKTIGSFDSSGYNTSTGVFTATIAGLYSFTLTLNVTQLASFGDIGFYLNSVSYLDGQPLTDTEPGASRWRGLTITTYAYLSASHTMSAGRIFNGGATATNTSWRGFFTGRLVAV